MKQIKCSECSEIWYAEDEDIQSLMACPFCSKEIRKKVKITGTDTLGKIIYQAVSNSGLEILSSVGRITGFLLDVAQGEELKREVKIFSKTFSGDYLRVYRDAFDMEVEEAEKTIKRLERVFIDEEGLSEEWAGMLCEDCLGAVKYYKEKGEEFVVSTEITDFGTNKSEVNSYENIIKKAEKGNAESQYKIGKYYQNGVDIEKDEKKAFEWYILAAEQDYTFALYEVGECYYNGKGVMLNKEKAFKWYKKAAEQGNMNAQQRVADYYYFGTGGIEQNEEEAVAWYQKVIEQGGYNNDFDGNEILEKFIKAAKQMDARAQYELGKCYEEGSGIEKDDKNAFIWYMLAAKKGNINAQYAIADYYYFGKGIIKQNEEKAAEWYGKVMKQGNYDNNYGENENIKKAMKQGDSKAWYKLGKYYQNGNGVEKDEKKAFIWYMLAAKKNHVLAMYEVGECYYNGRGVRENKENAFKWHKCAAEQGSINAQYRVGDYYYSILKDTQRAQYWYERAQWLEGYRK